MMILMLAGAWLMRFGLAVYSAGSVRSKNVASVLGRNMLDWTIGILVFWAVGMAIAAQTSNPYFGFDKSLAFGTDSYDQGLAGFVMVSVLGSIIIGATAERSRIGPILLLSAAAAGIVLPTSLHWATLGWLGRQRFVDYMGGATIHVAGAVMALVAVKFVGPRDGKYHRDGSASMIPGHSLPMILIGAWLAVMGGLMIVGGTTERIGPALNVMLCIAASSLTCAAYFHWRFSKIDLPVLAAAMLGGLAAISGAGGSVSQLASVIIGAVAGVLVTICILKFDLVGKIDDVTGAVSIHGVAAAWGVLAAGIFRADESVSRLGRLGVQAMGLIAIALLAAVVAWITLAIASRFVTLRIEESDEFDGLDLAEHDVNAYPDFQQISIKSFHLREQ